MGKRSLLLVDGDARSRRVLEVSLREAGFVVTTAVNGRDGLEKARTARPDLILSDTDMPEMDGFELCRAIKADPELARVPFVFLTGQVAIENKIRGLELGVDEYLTKPIYIKEILTRIRLLLQKEQRTSIETRRDTNTRFAGTLHDMGVVDLIQTIEVGRKSGLIHFSGPDGRQATIYFRNGAVIDAEAGHLQGADAVYRLLTWSDGEFELLFRTVRRKDSIDLATPALLMEGMRRLDEWGRLLEQLPPLTTRFEVDVEQLADRLAELPDELNHILRLFDGRRTLLEVIDLAGVGDLECIELVSRLYFEELLREVESGTGEVTSSDLTADLGLDGWLGQIGPDGVLPALEPGSGEAATLAEAEWDALDVEPPTDEVWPRQAVDSAAGAELAIDADEPPTPPTGVVMPAFVRDGARRVGSALGRVALVRRPSDGVDFEETTPILVDESETVPDVGEVLARGSGPVGGSVERSDDTIPGARPDGDARAVWGPRLANAPARPPTPDVAEPDDERSGRPSISLRLDSRDDTAAVGPRSRWDLGRSGVAVASSDPAAPDRAERLEVRPNGGRSEVTSGGGNGGRSEVASSGGNGGRPEVASSGGNGARSEVASGGANGGRSEVASGGANGGRSEVASSGVKRPEGVTGGAVRSDGHVAQESGTRAGSVGRSGARASLAPELDDADGPRLAPLMKASAPSDSGRMGGGSGASVGPEGASWRVRRPSESDAMASREDFEDAPTPGRVASPSNSATRVIRRPTARQEAATPAAGGGAAAWSAGSRGDAGEEPATKDAMVRGERARAESGPAGGARVGAGSPGQAGGARAGAGSPGVRAHVGPSRGEGAPSPGSHASVADDSEIAIDEPPTPLLPASRRVGAWAAVGVALPVPRGEFLGSPNAGAPKPGDERGAAAGAEAATRALRASAEMAAAQPRNERPDTEPGVPKPADVELDTDKTPLPDPIPLGEERSNPGIKSSRGAEVAMVSGEFGAVLRPTAPADESARAAAQGESRSEPRNGARSTSGQLAAQVATAARGQARTSRRMPSVELDQELSAAAEVVEPARSRTEESPRPVARAEVAAHVLPQRAETLPRSEPRVSSMIRAASGPAFARTFIVTVAGATLVGASFGMLFWWLSSREESTPAPAPLSAAVVESSPGERMPIASGSGDAPTASPVEAPSMAGLPGTAPAPNEPATSQAGEALAAAETGAPSGDAPGGAPPSASSSPSASGSGAAGTPPAGEASVASSAALAASGEATYEELVDEAKRAKSRRDYSAVLTYSTLALQREANAPTLTLQAEALLALKQPDRALTAVEGALALKPRHARAWYVKGRIHRSLGQTDRAREALNKYLEIDPEGRLADQVIDLLQDM